MTYDVFLGGTCDQNNWREEFIENLILRGVDKEALFNPVVDNWDEEAQKLEDQAKKNSRFMLYYLGDPKQDDNRVSFYFLLEATMGLYDNPNSTIVVFDSSNMPEHIIKSMNKACSDLQNRFPDAMIFESLSDVEDFLAEELRDGLVSSFF